MAVIALATLAAAWTAPVDRMIHPAEPAVDRPAAVAPLAIPVPHPSGRDTVGLDMVFLDSILSVVGQAVADGVTPGAVVAVGRSQGPAWIRAVGRTSWEAGSPCVDEKTLYDLASLTKVVATTSAIMMLVDGGRMELDTPLSRYLPEWPEGGWRDDVTIRRLLTHSAGLRPFVRFWHPAHGALRGRDTILAAIVAEEPASPPGTRYEYSDLGAILLAAAAEAVTDEPLDDYLRTRLFEPLDMHDTGFNPDVPLERIAPTEVDTVFRDVHVHGVVHDENAFAMGGVAGHAGLFSTAPDLAGFAGALLRARSADASTTGWTMARPQTVREFTRRQPGTERGLGWDVRAGTRIAEALSPAAFGHTGFTGTSLWIDPQRDIYVVLLTNRVNPTRAQGGIGDVRRTVNALAARAAEPPEPSDAPLGEPVDSSRDPRSDP